MPRQLDASDESGLPPYVSATVVTVGTFDGVHRGHQAMLNRLVEAAEDLGLPPGPIRPLLSAWLRYDFRLEAGVELWNAALER